MKLVALYAHPTDPDAFDKRYFEGHVPLVEKIPGLKAVKVTRFSRTLSGNGYYMMTEMEFGGRDTFRQAMKSTEMGVVGSDVNEFAGDLLTLMIGDDVRSEDGAE